MFKDPVLLSLIKKYEAPKFKNRSRFLFEDLVDSIVSQQLSTKAAATILKRFIAIFNNGNVFPKPEEILKIKDETIRKAGISFSKISYIKGVSKAFINNEINIKKINKMTDEEVLLELTKLKGVGRWTAEMILIFTLKRPDVFSLGDAGLRRAIKTLYKLDDPKKIETLIENWEPNKSSAAWYLWRSLENK